MSGEDWSDAENDIIVDDYFSMLADELASRRYVKKQHNEALQQRLPARSRGSIEFKHQNISAVMLGLGQPRIEGYKPASQLQMSLVDAVLRRLRRQRNWIDEVALSEDDTVRGQAGLRDPAALWLGPAPTFSNEPPPVDAELMAAVARRYDVAEQDARNRKLGEVGERYILDYERATLRANKRDDLAEQVVWTSKEEGDGAGYDIRSFESDGSSRLIEVKTTNGWERTPFHITRNEIRVAEDNRDSWCLVRLWNFVREPRAFEIRPPLETHVKLTPTSFLATLN